MPQTNSTCLKLYKCEKNKSAFHFFMKRMLLYLRIPEARLKPLYNLGLCIRDSNQQNNTKSFVVKRNCSQRKYIFKDLKICVY